MEVIAHASRPEVHSPSVARKDQSTHHHDVFRLRYGHPVPFGASLVPGGINFTVFSSNATSCTLVLFERDAAHPFAEIPFPPEFRMGDVFAMMVFDLNPEAIEYGYRMEGPFNPQAGHRFERSNILLDPFALSVGGRPVFGGLSERHNIFPHRGRIPKNNFDWEHDRPLDLPVS